MNDNFKETSKFEKDQLVVDREQKDLVTNFLRYGTDLEVDCKDENPTLGLALLTLTHVDAAADQIEKNRPEDIAKLRAELKASFEPIDAVLYDLRARIADRFRGWQVAAGKARMAGLVSSTPGTQGGPVAAFDVPKIPEGTPDWAAVVKESGSTGEDSPAGTEVTIGILDTNIQHPELGKGKGVTVRTGGVAIPIGGTIAPWAGHGTFVAGLMRAQAPHARIVVEPALSASGTATAWDVATKLAGFIEEQVDVLNLSFACHTADGKVPLIMSRVIEKLPATTVIVAAAGNHGGDIGYETSKIPMWPAALPGVVAVGARDGSGTMAAFSPKVPWVQCLAAGVDVLSIFPSADVELDGINPISFKGYARWSGTSFAAATVSGAIAATMRSRNLKAREALEYLLSTPNPVVKKYTWPDNS